MTKRLNFANWLIFTTNCLIAQTIGTFTSVQPTAQTQQFVIPSTHRFQVLAQTGDALSGGGTLNGNPDFTGYVPISNSSMNGYISLNHETALGGVSILDVNYNATSKLWQVTHKQACTMENNILGTSANCSGGVTPWGTVLSGEEVVSTSDLNADGYNDLGWLVEVNPVTRQCFRKIWAAGCMAHENAAVASNGQYMYFGSDSRPGYLYKYVFTTANDPTSGSLYVFKKNSGNNNGVWVLLANATQSERNNTQALATAAGATDIDGVEDVEIGTDGKIYIAAKYSQEVYRLTDNGSTTSNYETYMAAQSYPINYGTGTVNEPYAYAGDTGNDNLAFDGEGNLWIYQDGGRNHIWVVSPSHTAGGTDGVRLFATTPAGSEPTGITFSPDNKFIFMSIQHPSGSNTATQPDAAGFSTIFNRGTTLVIARAEHLGSTVVALDGIYLKAQIVDNQKVRLNWDIDSPNLKSFDLEKSLNGKTFSSLLNFKKEQNIPLRMPTDFLDENPNFNAITYYRLRMQTPSGERMSRIVSIHVKKNEFIIFPNPVTDELNLKFLTTNEKAKTTLNIFNNLGQLVSTQPLSGDFLHHLNLSNLTDGLYLVQVVVDGVASNKVVYKSTK